MSIGFRVMERERTVARGVVERALGVPTSVVSDSMWRLSAGGAPLRPRHRGGPMAGPALTVRTRPGDNLMVHVALDLAQPGDVIVVDAGGDLTNAILGELMVLHATRLGIAGIVVNGAIRDSDAIAAQSVPVYSAGITHRGPYKDGPGEINVPVAINGMIVEPGDLVIGDRDGVLAVPCEDAEAVLETALAKVAAERRAADEYRSGTADRAAFRDRAIALGASFPEVATR